MRKIIAYATLLLSSLLLFASCSETIGEDQVDRGTGTLSMKITTSRTNGDTYNPFEHVAVRIFTSEGKLTRKYSSMAEIPQRLELLADTYRITVEAGDGSEATFTNKSYYGEKSFELMAGKTTDVQVECLLTNTVVEVKFDNTIAQNFTQFNAWVMAAKSFDLEAAENGVAPALEYTTDGKGYFIMPEGVTTLACRFAGSHISRDVPEHIQILEDVKPQAKYVLTYKYSPDLPGFVTITLLEVDASEDEEDDTIIFSPDPTLTGVDFDVEQLQRYTTGERVFNIATVATMNSANLKVSELESYNLMDLTEPRAGLSVVKNNDTSMTVTLSDEFFVGRVAGNHAFNFKITDGGNGTLSSDVTFRLQGLTPVEDRDCNYWNNTLILKLICFDSATEHTFGLRKANSENTGEWIEPTTMSAEGDIYTATFASEWTESENDKGLKTYRMDSSKGLHAGHAYEYRASLGETQYEGAIAAAAKDMIPNGNMEGSLSCFGTNNSGSLSWGSGNNSMAKGLCTIGQMEGMGGAQCAKLTASVTLGNLASGNLFFGAFDFGTTSGTVNFGQKYTYTARPSAISLKYHAKIGTVDNNKHGTLIAKGSPDVSTVYACIVDWSTQRGVNSGMSGYGGVWSPVDQIDLAGCGKIIAYGIMDSSTSTEGNTMVNITIPLDYYDTTAPAPTGKYTLIVSASTSKYGDYMNGCSSNVMYVDDFEWVY